MLKKKSQAQIITTVLIILLVLAAIIIVWQVVNRTVSRASEEIETQSACISLNMEITHITNFEGGASLDDSVTVRRGTGSPEIEGVKALLFYKGNQIMEGKVNLGQLGTEVMGVGNTALGGPGIDLKEGEPVQVAALLSDGTACALSPEIAVPISSGGTPTTPAAGDGIGDGNGDGGFGLTP